MTKQKRFLTCISNASIKCKSLTKKAEKYEGTDIRHVQHTDKSHGKMSNKK